MTPRHEAECIGHLGTEVEQAEPDSTVALLYREFGDVLIPLEAVRMRYFRNRSPERFRRALRERTIPLPIVKLDESAKGQGYICLYHLAAFIEHRARESASERHVLFTTSPAERRLIRRLDAAVPATEFRPEPSGAK